MSPRVWSPAIDAVDSPVSEEEQDMLQSEGELPALLTTDHDSVSVMAESEAGDSESPDSIVTRGGKCTMPMLNKRCRLENTLEANSYTREVSGVMTVPLKYKRRAKMCWGNHRGKFDRLSSLSVNSDKSLPAEFRSRTSYNFVQCPKPSVSRSELYAAFPIG